MKFLKEIKHHKCTFLEHFFHFLLNLSSIMHIRSDLEQNLLQILNVIAHRLEIWN